MTLADNPAIEAISKQISELQQQRLEMIRQISGETVQDYELRRSDGSTVRLSGLFGDKNSLVLVHNMGRACPYCTLWADGFNYAAPYVSQEAGFALVTPDAPEKLAATIAERRWRFPALSSEGTSLFADLDFQDAKGSPWPGVSVLTREADGSLRRHTWEHFGPGDTFNNVFGFLELLPKKPVPEGKGDIDWFMPDLEGALKY